MTTAAPSFNFRDAEAIAFFALVGVSGFIIWKAIKNVKEMKDIPGAILDATAETATSVVEKLTGIPQADEAKAKQALENKDAIGILNYTPVPTPLQIPGVLNDAAGAGFQKALSYIGVPMTDAAKCEIAKANGDTLGVMNFCPAMDTMHYIFTSKGQ